MDLSCRYSLKNIFFRNKTFLFFKIKSWKFQELFEIEFREPSQNFNSFSSFRQLLFSFFLSVVFKFCDKQMLKFQLSILKNKKVLFLKTYFLSRCQYLHIWGGPTLQFMALFGQNIRQLTRLAWNVHTVNATYMPFIL